MQNTIDRNFAGLYILIAGVIALLALVDIETFYAFLKPNPIWMLLGVVSRAPLAKTGRGRARLLIFPAAKTPSPVLHPAEFARAINRCGWLSQESVSPHFCCGRPALNVDNYWDEDLLIRL